MRYPLYLLILAAAMLTPAIAQERQHCHKPSPWTTVCEFHPSGRVNVTSSFDDGQFFSIWFTHREWMLSHPRIEEYGTRKPSNPKSEAQAQSWPLQGGCEKDGFVWRDGACHAGAK